MKICLSLALLLGLGLSAFAQTAGAAYAPEQLDDLLGPVALYPDPLLALILPAATVPADITAAAAYLAAHGSPGGFDAQPWDPSVRALARYPDVVVWMQANLDWTQTLGAAFAQQPADVMKSVQQLRVRARAAGTLVDTPQQRVDLVGDEIRIVPVKVDTIYVPRYDPDLVYETQVGYSGPFITFGVGFPVGLWLGYQCDWDNYGIWMGPWDRGWGYQRAWRHPGPGGNAWHAWRPDPRRSREVVRNFYRPEGRLPAPHVITGYRGPARRAINVPRAPLSHQPVRPDLRGREVAPPHPSRPAPGSPLLGGYNRGAEVRESSNRGQTSRAAPVRKAPPSRPAEAPRAERPAHGVPPAREPPPARSEAPARDSSPPPADDHKRR